MTAILFNSLLPVTWVVLTSVLAFALLGWLEVKRNQKFLTARLLALLLAVLSVVCLILNPVLSTIKSSDSIILTPGYNNETFDSLLKVNSKSQVYKIQSVTGSSTALEIQNYRDLIDVKGNISILGEGVPDFMLDYIDTTSLQYFPGPAPEGIIGIKSHRAFSSNQAGEIKGVVNVSGNYTLTITGPGGAEDSIRVTTKTPQPFSLQFTPKAPGLYLYKLTLSDSSGDIRYTEHVPVKVKQQKPLAILFLSDYPTAEARFLKNFLETRDHKLTLRYKISKDRYRTEFINTPKKTVGRLNESLLQNFDLVLTDATSLTSLTVSEISSLKDAMKDGLGVLTIINTPALPKQATDLAAFKLSSIKRDSAQLSANQQRLKIPATPVSVSSEKKLFSIQQEASGRLVSGYYLNGLGKSGFQLLINTFSLELTGEKEAYAELWSPLIESVAREEITKYDLNFTTPFPYYPNEPIEFKIIAADEKPTVRLDSIEIPLVEDKMTKNVWFGKIWAGPVGWNSLHINQDSSQHDFFVSEPNAWRSLSVFNQHRNLKKISSDKDQSFGHVSFQPVSRLIFYLLFLLSAGFLWLAPKL